MLKVSSTPCQLALPEGVDEEISGDPTAEPLTLASATVRYAPLVACCCASWVNGPAIVPAPPAFAQAKIASAVSPAWRGVPATEAAVPVPFARTLTLTTGRPGIP